ncbi:MAG: hypothetical protein IJV80_05270 [Clostridia bacterium]|nr:hypothetical protein [Clostridia bacterium]
MEEKDKKTESLSLAEIIVTLFSKIKILILVLIVGGIIGCVYGYATSHNVHYYGTTLKFFVSPTVSSQSSGTLAAPFAKADEEEDDDDYKIEGQYSATVVLTIVDFLNSDEFARILAEDMDLLPDPIKDDATYDQKLQYKRVSKSVISRVKGSYTVSMDEKLTNNIFVKISVLNDWNFAENVMASVEKMLPEFVCEYMPVSGIYTGTKCVATIMFPEIYLLNSGFTRTQTMKFGIIFGAAAMVVAAVILVIVYACDTRLRDPDSIAKNFQVPVLGIIPLIDDALVTAQKTEKLKKTDKKEKKE